MKAYPYQSQPQEEASIRTTYVVHAQEPLSEEAIALAIADHSLSREGWGYVHPQHQRRWVQIDIFVPVGFAEQTPPRQAPQTEAARTEAIATGWAPLLPQNAC
jgi:hypothetical protein